MTEGARGGRHGSSDRLAGVGEELRRLLKEAGWDDLVADLPVPGSSDDPVRVAFVGPHNAGKSSLISALTGDLSIKRSAKPETTVATRYGWRADADLVDLPGWFGGFVAHDECAEEELRRSADLVAFVMTVELGDELVVDALEHVLGTLGFADRALVVVNKSQSEDSESDVVREEVIRRLGRFATVPVTDTDAQSFLDTVSGELDLDEESIQILTESSGIAELSEVLGDMVARHRDTARLQAQALQVARVAEEAAARLVPSDEEATALASLAELEAAIQRARTRLASLAASHLTQMDSGIEGIADLVLREDGLSESEHDHAWDAAVRPVEALAEAAEQLLDELAEEVSDVVSKMTFSVDRTSSSASLRPPSFSSNSSSSRPLAMRVAEAMGADLKVLTDLMAKAGKKIGGEGSGQGSLAYKLARDLQPKKRFVPYGRLKDAAKIKKVADVAAKAPWALPLAEETWKWWQAQDANRKAKKQDDSVRAHYRELARREHARVQTAFDHWADESLAPFEQKLTSGRAPLADVAVARNRLRERLAACRDAALDAGGVAGSADQQPT